MKAPGEIREHGSRFVIGMRGDVQDAGRDASVFDCLDGFWQTRTCAWGRRKLRPGRQDKNGEEQNNESSERKLRGELTMFLEAYRHFAASRDGAANGHSPRSRACTRKTASPRTITNNPHHMAFPV